MLLHKGVVIELSGHPMALQSLMLSGNHVDASGAGSAGNEDGRPEPTACGTLLT